MNVKRKQIAMLAVLVFGTFIAVLNQTVTTPALPSIMTEMSVDAATAQWLTTGFTLVNAIMIPVTAYLVDRYSVRRLFIVAMGIFSVGSLLAGWSPVFAILLAGRLVQASGAGILMPMVMAVLMLSFPLEKRGTAMGIFGFVIAFAPAIGPAAAGLVIDRYNWHIMFYAITALSIILIIFSLFFLDHEKKQIMGVKLDKPSLLLSSVGFAFVLYAFSAIGSSGFSILPLIMFLVGAGALVFFFRRQLKLDEPMLEVRVLKNRTFLIGTVIGMLIQASLLVAGIIIPIYLQSLRGYSATVSGLVILPGAVLMGITGLVAGRLFDKHGPRALSIVGLSILSLSTFGFAFLNDSTDLVYFTILNTIRTFSIALVNMPITTWAMNALDDKLINHGSSVNNTLRQVAGSFGTALLISVMTIASKASGVQTGSNVSLFGINLAFFIAGLFCVGGLVLALLLVKDRPGQYAEADPENKRRIVLESIMKRDVYTIEASATVHDAMAFLVDKKISAAPLVDEKGQAVGFLSDGDIMRFLSKRSQSYIDPVAMIIHQTGHDKQDFNAKLKDLMGIKVQNIGTKRTIGVGVHDDLPEVCRVLGENHLKKVPVLDNGQVVGIINRSDITQYSMKLSVKNGTSDPAFA